MSRADRTVGADGRWVARPIAAALVRAGTIIVPAGSGWAAGIAVAQIVSARTVPLLGIVSALGVSVAVAIAVESLARRLLPLATLLKLSLAFPDRVPSRFRVARQAGNARVLHERVRLARERGTPDDPAQAAEEILALVAALSAHDRKTRGHSERVRAFTDLLADELELPEVDRDRLRWAALLHDIGKLQVPAATLNKAGKPDEAEWEQLRRHPLEGERIVRGLAPWLGSWGAVIAQHHERFDGAGYPRAIRGRQIHLGARIVAVADSFEVMTAARSYKRPMTPLAARRELAACAGQQFDPMVVRAMFSVSLGRLWWMVGPTAWIAQVPFMLGLGRAGTETVAAVRTASDVAVRALTAVVALALSVATGVARAPAPPLGAVRGRAIFAAPTAIDAGRAHGMVATSTSGAGRGDPHQHTGVAPPTGGPGDATDEADPGTAAATTTDSVESPSPQPSGSLTTDTGGTLSDTAGTTLDNATTTVSGVTQDTQQTVSDTTTTVADAVDTTVDQTASTVSDTTTGVTKEVSSAVQSVGDATGDPLGP
jgi:putative nucleotidyltransferase with HDIG domain